MGTENLDAWATTADWRLPLAHHFQLSGEAYRGRAIGGLGGGVYKDVVTGADPISGEAALRGLNAPGGWAQLEGPTDPMKQHTNKFSEQYPPAHDRAY